ncbi:MAG: phosphotransferase family protein [Gammaproteobacteria bacterium]|nr:phosphotransferase family protein [Gammaproteobacteria bacterium]HCP50465.1 phosphotransferase family protein [Gammaproteobacteria bacterium]|tara:strand:+ start:3412 stop:4467 length:1056 start_codon:yes stop_codon:yes gene_type:complete
MSDVELTPVRPAHVFDEDALETYMATYVDGFRGPMKVQQFEGGQSNPTFLLEAPTGRYVLRKQPPGELLPSAHQVDREYRVMDALYETDVPVPKMYALCEDANVIGTKFYIMEMVEGRLYTKTTLPELTPGDRREVYLDMARVLAALHRVDPTTVGLGDFRRPGNYFDRQVNRWTKQYLASETENIDAMNRLIDWLPSNIPTESSSGIVHGDFRLGNLLLHETLPKIVAILDWELWSVGDALADLGYLCQEYHYLVSETEDMLPGADLETLGIPAEEELVQTYRAAARRGPIDNWTFYIVYNMFRSAGIIQGVYKRGLDGNASSDKALEYEGVARVRAERAWELITELGLR